MKKAKKLLSLLLAVMMLFSCMSVGIGGIAVFAAAGGSVTVTGTSSVTYNRTDDVIICVPETIYMSPTTGASVSGQYFVNNIVDSSGKVTLATDRADTTGQISIYAPGATAFSLDVTAAVGSIGEPVIGGSSTDANSTYEGTTWNFSNFGNASDYATFDGLQLFINGTGVSMGSMASIKWAVTLTYSTGNVTYYVYSTLYTPHLSVGAVSESRRSGTYNNEISSWISGTNGVVNSSTWSPISTGYGDSTTAGYFTYDPLISGLYTGGSSESSNDYITSSTTWVYAEGKAPSGADWTRAVSYLGKLNIDASRYSNINQIPNLTIGSDALRVNSSKKDSLGRYYAWWIIGDNTKTIGTGEDSTPSGWTQFVNLSEPAATSRNTVVPSYEVSSINGLYIHTASQGYCTYLSNKNYANACASVLCTTVNKADLRKLVLQCSSLNKANYAYGWDWFIQAYENAAYVLGNPCATETDISTAISRLNTTINGGTDSALGTCPGLQIDVAFNGNGGSVSAATQRVTIGTATTVSVTPSTATRTGYTFKGWSTSSSATSGSTANPLSVSLYNRNLYATWSVNKYKIIYDNMLDLSGWDVTNVSQGTTSDITDNGFTLTIESEQTGTYAEGYVKPCNKFPVTPGATIYVSADMSGSSEDLAKANMFIFFYTADGTSISHKSAYSELLETTVPDNAAYANIRIGIAKLGAVVRFENIRIYEATNPVAAGISYHASKEVTYDSTYGTLPTPTRPGYVFAGWYDTNGAGYWENDKVTITSDKSLYSKWNPNTYTVTFEKNIGDGTSTQTNYTPDDSVTVPTLTRVGYTLTGWLVTTAAGNWSGTYNAGDVLTGMYGSAILQAQWAIANYTITYDANGGSCSETTKSYTISDTVTLPTPTKTGYTFAGWKVASTDGNWSGTNLKGNVSSKYGAVTLQAQWTPIPYAITFVDWNGDVLQQTDVNYDSKPTPPADPTRAADNGYTYTFKGWDPTVVTVTGAATYTATYNATLIPYTITLDAGEGSVSTSSVAYNYESTSVTLPAPTRTGYTFTGWTVKSSAGSWTTGDAVDGALANDYGNVTLIANYTPNQYTVTYDANGGTIADGYNSTFTATYDATLGELLAEIDRTGYTFTGWNTAADGTGETVAAGDVWKYTSDKTIYAQWTAIEYTINFLTYDMTNRKNNFVAAPDALTYTIEDDLSAKLPDTTVEGYDFSGWIADNTAGTWRNGTTYATADLGTGNWGDVTLVMTYTAKSYTITWVNYDGEVLETDTAFYGSTPSYDSATPEHTPTEQYSYTFAGWSPDVTTVTGNQTYTATYNETEREYTVKFVDWNGDVISEQSLKYGATPETPADPTREQDAQYTYTFSSWKDEADNEYSTIPNVKADVTYTADYTALVRSYTITWIVDGVETEESYEYGATPSYKGTPVKDKTAEYTYTFTGWSPSITDVTGEATYTAQFSSEKNSYTVKFVDEDGTTVLDTQTLEYGETPVYAGEIPTKAADAQYTYTFAGWDPVVDTVTGDVTYTATYTETVNKYTVTWVDEDGTVLDEQTVAYGATPVYAGTTPTKAATAQYTYTFAEWTPEVVAVTGNATYKAVYTATTNEYTITFVDEDGTELQSSKVAYGTVPTAPADPTKTGDVQYSYTFAGWTPEVVAVTGTATYKATYTQSVNKYTITFVDDDNTELQSSEVEYGTVPTAPANPTKAADAQYTYTFAGWDKTVVAVTGDTTYKATYSTKVNQYTVTFKDYDGSVIETQTLDYGATPTAPADPTRDATAEWTYTFSSWTPAINEVTGDATYTAQYTATKNSYKITWIVNGVETTDTVEYGETPTFTGSTDKAADAQYTYTFASWSPAVVAVTGNATYTATYTETVNQYTVTFYDENGTTVLDTQTLDYGSSLEYKGSIPTKAPVAGVEYAFSGWTTTKNGTDVIALPNVKGNASYYAVYIATNIELDVTIIEEDGTSTTTKVQYGTFASELTFDNNQTKAQDAQYTYSFIGWNVVADSETALDLATYKITANTTFYPAYSKTVREYTITFYDENGTSVLETKTVPYGTVPTAAAPTKAATAQYTYTFAGWTPEVVAVTGDATYKATYTATVNKYTITFLNDDDSVLKTVTLEYGATPEAPVATKAATAQYTYTFAAWDKPVVAVTGDATYKATYDSTVNKYVVKFVDEDGTELQSSEVAYGVTPAYTGSTPTKTGDAQFSYTFKEWSPAISSVTGVATYTATYTQSVNKYTIQFVNENGDVLQKSEWEYGSTPAYTGETPTKVADAQYTYTFKDWDNAILSVTGDATYTATYDSTVNKYTITFKNENGDVLQESKVEYGTVPTYTGATPTKAADAQYTYTFKDWDNSIVSVTGEATYTATYDKTVNKYTIKFVNDNGDELQSSEVAYGDTPVYTGATPTKATTAQYTYTFKDWDNAIVAVTGEAIYTATYDATVNKYTIKFVNEDGTELQSSEVAYGDTPVYTGATPTKDATAQYTYTHSGWTPAVVAVTGETIYTATYDATVNKYTIVFENEDGSILQSSEVEYGIVPEYSGEVPTKAPTAQYSYTFEAWNTAIVAVTGEATYTATYAESIRKYTITWIVDGVTTTEDVEYGTVPTAPADPTKASTDKYEYSFTGWDNEVVEVTGDATYTAEFAESIRKYTITWVVGDTKTTTTVAYGDTPVFDGTPTLAPTAEREYTFTNWSPVITTVTGEKTYTAQFSEKLRSYTITYVIDGTVVDTQILEFGSNFSHPEIPEKEGYSSYWSVDYMTMPAQDITVNAVYTEKKYTATWVVNGETVYEEKIPFGSSIPEKIVPEKVGHDGEWDNVPSTMPAEDITITAVYTPATYTVVWTFATASGTDTATYGETWSVVFINYVPGDVRITINGVLLSADLYSYNADSGYLQINADAITGNVTITERAAEGYQNVTISAVNATVTNASSIVKEGTAFHTQIVPNEGYLLPKSVVVCIDGIELHSGYSYDLTTGRLTINGDVIYGELSIRFESPVDPEYGTTNNNHRCTCSCHSSNAFIRFFYSIATFFRKLFGMEQYHYCGCGVAHW